MKLRKDSTIKMSKPSKMPCYSWSLQAIETCAGSIDTATGLLVPACQGCYATTGFYLMTNTIKARASNKQDWKRETWCEEMISALESEKYFRWFDSGDVYSFKLAEKILKVMASTPHVKHWLPTRMHKFDKFRHIFELMNSLPNVVVRFSSDSITGQTVAGQYTSTIIPKDYPHLDSLTVCSAPANRGKCLDCRECWSKHASTIAYVQHGRKMAKVNDLKLKLKNDLKLKEVA